MVKIPGMQPYLPLPQRKVGRIRGRVARPIRPYSQPATFKSLDIRDYFRSKGRAAVHHSLCKPNAGADQGASADVGEGQVKKRLRGRTKED